MNVEIPASQEAGIFFIAQVCDSRGYSLSLRLIKSTYFVLHRIHIQYSPIPFRFMN